MALGKPKNKMAKWRHVNKIFRHESMKRLKLKNKVNKAKSPSNINNYQQQRNYNVQLNRKVKLAYLNMIQANIVNHFG